MSRLCLHPSPSPSPASVRFMGTRLAGWLASWGVSIRFMGTRLAGWLAGVLAGSKVVVVCGVAGGAACSACMTPVCQVASVNTEQIKRCRLAWFRI